MRTIGLLAYYHRPQNINIFDIQDICNKNTDLGSHLHITTTVYSDEEIKEVGQIKDLLQM